MNSSQNQWKNDLLNLKHKLDETMIQMDVNRMLDGEREIKLQLIREGKL